MRIRKLKRQEGTHCESSFVIPPTFHEGQETACWAPAAGHAYDALSSFYACGNTYCIKVIDPAEEFMNKQRDAPLYITYGSAFLITGLSLSCILFAFSQYATKVEEAKAKLVEMSGGESGEVSSVKVENSI